MITSASDRGETMRKRKWLGSFRSRIWAFILALFLSLGLLLFYNNYHATRILRSRLYETASEGLSQSQKRLNDGLTRSFTFLSTFIFENVDIKSLEDNSIHTTSFHTSLERVRRKFANSLPIYTVDSFFYFNPYTGVYFANLNTINHPLGKMIRDLSPEKWRQATRGFIAVPAQKERYLLRAVKVSSSYIGAWISIPYALRIVQADQLAGSHVYLLSGGGEVLDKESGPILPGYDLSSPAQHLMSIGGERWLAAVTKAGFGDFYLLALMRDATVTSSLNRLTLIILAASLAGFLVIFLVSASLARGILKPVSTLTNSIRALQSGDYSISLPEAEIQEFMEVNAAFNEAVEQIEDMKIDLYEDRLRNQHIHLQYLQLQMPPHFLLNCLNTIYQLTAFDRLDLTRELIRALSDHLRYTLRADQWVSLKEELFYAENYVQISKIRYPDSIAFFSQIDEAVQEAKVVPLLVLNFIENAIKFEAELGKSLAIHLEAKLIEDKVRLSIWDTGEGYSQNFLEDIKDLPAYLSRHRNEHIGIANVIARARLVNPGIQFHFSNREKAGAQIEVIFPLKAKAEMVKK